MQLEHINLTFLFHHTHEVYTNSQIYMEIRDDLHKLDTKHTVAADANERRN